MSSRAWAGAAGVAGATLLALAVILAAWPAASALRGAWAAEAQFCEAEAACAQMDPEAVGSAFDGARAANARMARGGSPADAAAEVASLDADGTGVVSWVEVPRIGLKAPVYAEASDANLMEGAALAAISSLPVGGAPSNTVVVGHTGMVGLQMFDRLDELEPGDEVLLWTLGERLRYEVEGSEVVEVGRAEAMVRPEEGRDIVTLVTCRPYGVNSHRLVVRAVRSEPVPSGAAVGAKVGPDAIVSEGPSPWVLPCAAGIAALAASLALVVWVRRPWRLVCVTGARPLAERDVAELCRGAEPMRIDMRWTRSLRLRLFGVESRGAWERYRDDLGVVYRMELDCAKFGPYRLPGGAFCARESDGGLVIWADDGANALHFERRRPSGDVGKRLGKDDGDGRIS